MEALRRYLGLGPMVSIGTSYGGMVAMAHAARYPDAVSRLILIVTAAHGGFIPRAEAIVRERGTPEQQRVCETLWAGGFRTPEQLRHYYEVMGPLYARSHDPAAAAAGRAARSIRRSRSIAPSVPTASCGRSTSGRSLARITAPTLILAGRHDWICPVEFSEELHRLIPGSRLRDLRGQQSLGAGRCSRRRCCAPFETSSAPIRALSP